jgi:hypothetical protein
MKFLVRIVFVFTTVLFITAALACSASGQSCERVVIRDHVEISEDDLFLADLFAPPTCPAIMQAAAKVRIGAAPLPGGKRVLSSDVVQSLLEKLLLEDQHAAVGALEKAEVPSRITVRRSSRSLSCVEIGHKIFSGHAEGLASAPVEIDCSAVPRIPEGAALEVTKKSWDPATLSWNVFARCAAAECLPFVLHVRDPNHADAAPGVAETRAVTKKTLAQPLVRRGETVTLLWDQDGIRMTVPVVCLDPGEQGQRVRARVVHSGGSVRAVVVSAGLLRIAS